MRLPHAANVLIGTVRSERKNAKVEPVSDPDGLDVVRTIRFDKATSKWLHPLLETLADSRIEDLDYTDAGYLRVTFVATRHADNRDPFPLDAAATVAGDRT